MGTFRHFLYTFSFFFQSKEKRKPVLKEKRKLYHQTVGKRFDHQTFFVKESLIKETGLAAEGEAISSLVGLPFLFLSEATLPA